MYDFLPIIGVALRHGDIIVALPKPHRHHHCFAKMKEIGIKNVNSGSEWQGFYLENGTFLNRKEAFVHAQRTKQIINPKAKELLYSEDLW